MQKLLILILLAVSISSNYAQETAIIPSQATWTNTDSVTYFAIERFRMERILLKAELYDTTFALLVRQDEINQDLRASKERFKMFTIMTSAFILGGIIYGATR